MYELSIFYLGITYTLASVLMIIVLAVEEMDSRDTLLSLTIWVSAPISLPLITLYLIFFD